MNTDILLSTLQDGRDSSGASLERLPSFYEIIIVDQIDAMLKPAFRQFLNAVLESMPSSMVELMQLLREHWEEVYDLLLLVVQLKLIKSQGATLAERLYGLERRSIHGSESFDLDKFGKPIVRASSKLKQWQQDISIFMVAVLPRIATMFTRTAAIVRSRVRARAQIQEAQRRNDARHAATAASRVSSATATAVEITGENAAAQGVHVLQSYRVASSSSSSLGPYVQGALRRSLEALGGATAIAVPYVVAGCGAIVTVQRLRYLFGYTPYHHPILEMAKTVLVRRNADLHGLMPSSPDAGAGTMLSKGNPQMPGGVGGKGPRATGSSDYRVLTLVTVLVALKVVHWVTQQQEEGTMNNAHAIGIPPLGGTGPSSGGVIDDILPPPPPPGVGRGCVVPSSDPHLKEGCPLCGAIPRVTECASTGGYLFCYTCLIESLRRDEANGNTPSCPVTGIPCLEQDIIIMHAGGG
jgi:hypothetical protein